MSVFSAAIDAIFANPEMAADATWIATGSMTAIPCRVIRKAPDAFTDFGGARIVSDTLVADVRASEVAAPRRGDRIDIGSAAYIIQGAPAQDREGLVWTLELRPQCE